MGASEFVGDGFGLAKNTSEENESRGIQRHVRIAIIALYPIATHRSKEQWSYFTDCWMCVW